MLLLALVKKLETGLEIEKQITRVRATALQDALKELEAQKNINKNKLDSLAEEILRRKTIVEQAEELFKISRKSLGGDRIRGGISSQILRDLLGTSSRSTPQGKADVKAIDNINRLIDLVATTGTEQSTQDLIDALVKLTAKFELGGIAPEIVGARERVTGDESTADRARFETTKVASDLIGQFIRELRDQLAGQTATGDPVEATKI
jgi:hypothetical protein